MVKKSTSGKASSKMLAPKKTAPKKTTPEKTARTQAEPRPKKSVQAKQRGKKPPGNPGRDLGDGLTFEGPTLYLSKKNTITAKEILSAAKREAKS